MSTHHPEQGQSKEELIREFIAKGEDLFCGSTKVLFVVALVVGIAAMVLGFLFFPQRAWLALHVNTIFWTCLSFGGIVLSAAAQITSGKWIRTVKRFGESTSAFLPIGFVLFIVIFALGAGHVFPWHENPVAGKEWWLSLGRVATFDLIALAVLMGLTFAFLYYALRADVGVAKEKYQYYTQDLAHYLVRGWEGTETEVARSQKNMSILAPLIAIGYGLVLSVVAFDLIMSLDPHWYSTLFGGYFFVANFYCGLAFTGIIAATAWKRFNLGSILTEDVFHDLGKMVFAFSIATTYLFWSQFMIIWYANLPEELPFVMKRIYEYPWRPFALAAIIGYFVLPFLLLIFKNNKTRPLVFKAICFIPFTAIILERFVLVYPSIFSSSTLGIFEVAVTLGFAGLFGLCMVGFLSQFPALSVGDPHFDAKVFAKGIREH